MATYSKPIKITNEGGATQAHDVMVAGATPGDGDVIDAGFLPLSGDVDGVPNALIRQNDGQGNTLYVPGSTLSEDTPNARIFLPALGINPMEVNDATATHFHVTNPLPMPNMWGETTVGDTKVSVPMYTKNETPRVLESFEHVFNAAAVIPFDTMAIPEVTINASTLYDVLFEEDASGIFASSVTRTPILPDGGISGISGDKLYRLSKIVSSFGPTSPTISFTTASGQKWLIMCPNSKAVLNSTNLQYNDEGTAFRTGSIYPNATGRVMLSEPEGEKSFFLAVPMDMGNNFMGRLAAVDADTNSTNGKFVKVRVIYA